MKVANAAVTPPAGLPLLPQQDPGCWQDSIEGGNDRARPGSIGPLARRRLRSTGSLLLCGLVLASCATTPSPSPSLLASQRPSSTPAAEPTATAATSFASTAGPTPPPDPEPTPGGWPYPADGTSQPVFGLHGTAYLLADAPEAAGDDQSSLVAVDASGRVVPGWPIKEAVGSDFGQMLAGSDGSLYMEECGARPVGCALHRFGSDGVEPPGWPFEVPTSSACLSDDQCSSYLVIGPGGTAYLTSWHQTRNQTQLIAIDGDGKVVPGWPVAVDDPYGYSAEPELGADGTLFILSGFDERENAWTSLAAFAADGSPRPGWPVSLPAIAGFRVGPRGTVVVVSFAPLADPSQGGLCSDASRTVFTAFGLDGRTLPGWPRGSKGFASGPVIDAEGTVSYLSALGNVYAHDRSGTVKVGWPVSVPEVFPGCGFYGPYLGPDRTVYVLGAELDAILPDGSGWRYRPTGGFKWPCFDMDCVPVPAAPAFGPDGTVYVAVPLGDSSELVALDHDGLVKPGWPYPLPVDPTKTPAPVLTVSPDGRLYVGLGDTMVLALDPDGQISD